MPQPKKHASARARRNKAATAAELTDVEPEDRSGWTAAQLRKEIDRRNGDGRPDDERLSKGGGKSNMLEVLLEDDFAIPPLPDVPYGWNEMTVQWWRDVWTSPMSNEWHPESDYHNVTMAAMHYDDFWKAGTALERQKATALFVKMCDFLGLNPYARRRLEWTIANAETAADGVRRRRERDTRGPVQPPAPAVDPRMRLVK